MINKLCGNIPEIKGYHEFEQATEAANGTTIGLLYYKYNALLLGEIQDVQKKFCAVTFYTVDLNTAHGLVNKMLAHGDRQN